MVQPQTPPVEPPPAPPAVGERSQNYLDAVIISLGEAHGLHKGDNVEVFAEETRLLGQGNETRVERRVLIGKVTDVGEDRAEVALGTNEEVPTHARVRPTSAPSTALLIRPRRADDLWEISATIRPFLALGTLGARVVSRRCRWATGSRRRCTSRCTWSCSSFWVRGVGQRAGRGRECVCGL